MGILLLTAKGTVTSRRMIAMRSRWVAFLVVESGSKNMRKFVIFVGFCLLQVTKRVGTSEDQWRGWNWRSEGDVMANGAFFVASGEGVEVKYEKAYSVEPKSAAYIDQLTLNAGVLGNRSLSPPLSISLKLNILSNTYLDTNLFETGF